MCVVKTRKGLQGVEIIGLLCGKKERRKTKMKRTKTSVMLWFY